MYINLIPDVIPEIHFEKNQLPKINIQKYWKLENINYKKIVLTIKKVSTNLIVN